MNTYAASCVAEKVGRFHHTALLIKANNEIEGEGIAQRRTAAIYPTKDGWTKHHVQLANKLITAKNCENLERVS